MAAKRERVGITQLLSSAACEWFLILLLFAHASLSRLLSSFAKYCQLEPPCILCSSALGGGENGPKRYWTLLCAGHRQEVSTLVSCSVHHRFADVHSMCDECLSPIVNHNKSTSDSYRLLVGKSLLDVDRSVLQNLVLNKHVRLGPPDHRTCSCCGKTWKAKSGSERLIEFSPNKSNVKPPLSPAPPRRAQLSRRDSLKRLRDKFTEHVGYTKLRISSDGESEFPCFSEDGDDDSKGGIGIASNNSCPDLIDLGGGGGGSRMNGKKKSLSVNVVFDWKECCEKTSPCLPSPCLTPGVLSLRDDSRLFDVGALSVLSDFLSMCNVPNSPNAGSIQMKRTVEKEGGTPKAKNIKPVVDSSSEDNPEQGPPSKETSPIADEPKTVEDLHECENDKILLANLYRDLEEERNASAIAANQAMAMITRLQEEKAALHMEALQYLRMMEEQAEYDTEALGRANEMLAEKEKEVQDLEIELEFYRNNFLDESAVHNLQSETKSGDSVLKFEEDKAHILRCLEKLETSLRNEEGDLVRENRIELVREVAHQLQELKKVEFERRSLFVHHED